MVSKRIRKSDPLPFVGILLLWILQLAISLGQDTSLAASRYDISTINIRFLQIVLSLPTLFIWSVNLFAALSFSRYTRRIAGSADANAFRYIGHGLYITLVGTILTSFVTVIGSSMLASSTMESPGHVLLTMINNYLSIVFALGTYWYIFKGSRVLLKLNKQKPRKQPYSQLLLAFAAIAIVYLYLIFTNAYRTVSADGSITPTYGLSDPLILLTVAIPYLIAWGLGLAALVGIRTFEKETPGILYKRLFRKLSNGLGLVILLTIVLQLLSQLGGYWAGADLSVILGLIAIIYVVLIYAYHMIAVGARQLGTIEDLEDY